MEAHPPGRRGVGRLIQRRVMPDLRHSGRNNGSGIRGRERCRVDPGCRWSGGAGFLYHNHSGAQLSGAVDLPLHIHGKGAQTDVAWPRLQKRLAALADRPQLVIPQDGTRPHIREHGTRLHPDGIRIQWGMRAERIPHRRDVSHKVAQKIPRLGLLPGKRLPRRGNQMPSPVFLHHHGRDKQPSRSGVSPSFAPSLLNGGNEAQFRQIAADLEFRTGGRHEDRLIGHGHGMVVNAELPEGIPLAGERGETGVGGLHVSGLQGVDKPIPEQGGRPCFRAPPGGARQRNTQEQQPDQMFWIWHDAAPFPRFPARIPATKGISRLYYRPFLRIRIGKRGKKSRQDQLLSERFFQQKSWTCLPESAK